LAETAYASESLENLFTQLDTSERGLSKNEAARRLIKYGRNEIKEAGRIPWWRIFLTQFNSPVIWVLLGAVVVSLVIGESIDATVIVVILVLNAVLGFVQEFRAEKAVDALKKMAGLKATVMRDGSGEEIDATEVVPGDVIILDTGKKVPADCRVIEEVELETQEATLTGESTPVIKDVEITASKQGGDKAIGDMTGMVFAGTVVTRGHGRALVCATGMQTEIGKIAEMIQTADVDESPLQKQLATFGKWLGILTVVVCAVVFLTGLLIHEGEALEIFFAAVALAVAAIPEGLPAVVTISLSLGVRRMVARNALVRHLPSVETLGCTTVICSDKTGTLTRNEMTVKRIFVSGKDVGVEGSGYKPEGGFSVDASELELILRIGALNNDATVDRGTWGVTGDPTEACLITSALKGGLDKVDLDSLYPRIGELPFDSERKRMTTVHEIDGKRYAYVKGAPDLLLEKCDRMWVDGEAAELNDSDRQIILSKNEEYAAAALRVLGFAYQELAGGETKETYEECLVFVGLQAMIDPPREEVKEAIARCKAAGIKVVMVTGDLMTTAQAIGKDLDIKGETLSGAELHTISDEDLERKIDQVSIYARVNPADKVKIVRALEKRGHVVAMTGDGVNDAPALKEADIGIAMGITGTDVATEASDMILTDDNFASIVSAVEEGRGIYDNLRKFVNYLLSGNIGEVLIILVGTLMGLPLPLIAVQLLWVNLVTDGLPAVALGVDPVARDAMARPPRRPTDRIMSPAMSLNVLSMGLLMCVVTLAMYHVGLRESLQTGRTMAFMTLVLMEIVRLQMIRSAYHTSTFSNRWLIWAVLISLGLQLGVVYTPLSVLFKVGPLGGTHWLYMAAALVCGYIIARIMTVFIRRTTHELA
jgi:Ca2+-transporting ATPase